MTAPLLTLSRPSPPLLAPGRVHWHRSEAVTHQDLTDLPGLSGHGFEFESPRRVIFGQVGRLKT
jgi:hypothetical protein